MDFKATILNEADINRTLVRMSHQIIERNHGTDGLCLIGIRTAAFRSPSALPSTSRGSAAKGFRWGRLI